MRVAAGINQQVAEQTIYEPWRRLAELADLLVHFLERNIKLVKRVVARFVNARRLRRRADEQTAEQPAQRRMVLPIRQQRAQQIRPAQHGRIRRRLAADDDVIAAAGAGVTTVHHEFLRAEPRLARFLVKRRCSLDKFFPSLARVHVHFDHAGVRCDGKLIETRIFRRCFAFDNDGQTGFGSGCFNARDKIQIIFRLLHWRHENMQPSVARLDTKRGANDPRRGLARLWPAIRIFFRFQLRLFFPLAKFLCALAGAITGWQCCVTTTNDLAAIRKFFWQFRQIRLRRILCAQPRKIFFRNPRHGIQRQAQAHRGVAGDQPERVVIAQKPGARNPALLLTDPRTFDRQRVADDRAEALLENPGDTLALLLVLEIRFFRRDVRRKTAFLP